MLCPVCKTEYCNKPKTERKLFVLQNKYYRNGEDQAVLNEISAILVDYARSFLKKYYISYIQTEGHIDYYAFNAVSFFIDDILSKGVKVEHSFGGLLNLKIKQILFQRQERLQEDISINWHFDDNHQVQHENNIVDILTSIENEEGEYRLLVVLIKLLLEDNIHNISPHDNYLRLLALLLYFTKGETCADQLFLDNTFGRSGKYSYLQTLSLMYHDLMRKD